MTGSGLVLIVAAALLAGCGDSGGTARSKEVSHLRAITALYFKATSALGHVPQDEAEFKQAISQGELDLSVLGVSSVDELFVSDRDGQPLAIVYGKAPQGVSPGVVAWEREGTDGVRLVGFSSGQVEEADAARFAKLVPAPPL